MTNQPTPDRLDISDACHRVACYLDLPQRTRLEELFTTEPGPKATGTSAISRSKQPAETRRGRM